MSSDVSPDVGTIRTRRILKIGAIIIGVGLILAALTFVLLVWVVNPVANERPCSGGDAPATKPDGTTACFHEGGDLPPGWTWDPDGNRPYDD